MDYIWLTMYDTKPVTPDLPLKTNNVVLNLRFKYFENNFNNISVFT